ncbi:MAG: OmpA family protein [Pseudomonadota bacterium]
MLFFCSRKVLISQIASAALLVTMASAPASYAQDEKVDANEIVDFFSKEKDGLLTRGICIGTADECEPKTERKLLDMFVAFELNSAQLTPDSISNLEQFAEALSDETLEGLDFQVAGHTDARGTAEYNLDLSTRRADAVKSKLEELGVDGTRLNAIGFGEEQPRSEDPLGAENRRVEISLD